MSIRVAIITLGVLGVMTGFQNCGSPQNIQSTKDYENKVANAAQQEVLGSVSNFNKIVYDPLLEVGAQNKAFSLPRIEIDVEAGSVRVASGAANLDCQLDSTRLDAIKSILATAKVCEAKQEAVANSVRCMANASADIQLSNGQSSVLLKPNMCGAGVFLCDDLDKAFREVLNSLRDNPPVNCSAQ